MKKFTISNKTKRVGKAFWSGFKVQMTDGGTLGLACTLGLWQGLKYKGSLIRGITTTVIVTAGFSVVNGIRSVALNADFIKGTTIDKMSDKKDKFRKKKRKLFNKTKKYTKEEIEKIQFDVWNSGIADPEGYLRDEFGI